MQESLEGKLIENSSKKISSYKNRVVGCGLDSFGLG
jgi:hypothetical protein